MPIQPHPDSINMVRAICEPWIQLWGGDEWGESMAALHGAAQTSYGFSDEDCALFASKLLENLLYMKDEMDAGLAEYMNISAERLEEAQQKCRQQREYWLAGANHPGFKSSMEISAATLPVFPGWMFGE